MKMLNYDTETPDPPNKAPVKNKFSNTKYIL